MGISFTLDISCDNCNKTLEENEDCYCEECYEQQADEIIDLEDKVVELEGEIERLKKELKKHEPIK